MYVDHSLLKASLEETSAIDPLANSASKSITLDIHIALCSSRPNIFTSFSYSRFPAIGLCPLFRRAAIAACLFDTVNNIWDRMYQSQIGNRLSEWLVAKFFIVALSSR